MRFREKIIYAWKIILQLILRNALYEANLTDKLESTNKHNQFYEAWLDMCQRPIYKVPRKSIIFFFSSIVLLPPHHLSLRVTGVLQGRNTFIVGKFRHSSTFPINLACWGMLWNYGISLWVLNFISHALTALAREISSWTLKGKFRI